MSGSSWIIKPGGYKPTFRNHHHFGGYIITIIRQPTDAYLSGFLGEKLLSRKRYKKEIYRAKPCIDSQQMNASSLGDHNRKTRRIGGKRRREDRVGFF